MCDVSQPLGFTDRLNDPVSLIASSQVVGVRTDMSTTVAVQLEGFSLVVAAYTLSGDINQIGIVSGRMWMNTL